MTLDLTQFHETFFAESFEALDSMEAALLKLSAGDADLELVNTIFRVAHSIKGGSATFGFTDVAAFTHTLETLLDQMRGGKRRVDSGAGRYAAALRRPDARDAGRHPGQAAHRQGARGGAARRDRTDPGHGRAPARRRHAAPAAAGAGARRCVGRVMPAAAGASISSPVPNYCATATIRCACCASSRRSRPARCASTPSGCRRSRELDPEECRLSWRIEVNGAVEESAHQGGVRLGRRRVRPEPRSLRSGG